MLQLETINTLKQLDNYAEAWDDLALKALHQHPSLTYSWISAYLRTCVLSDQSWFCLLAFDDNELVGVLPLIVEECYFLSNKYVILKTPNDKQTLSVDFLFTDKYGERIIQLFYTYLNNLRPKVIKLQMGWISYNSTTKNILQNHFPGIKSIHYTYRSTSIISVNGSFHKYKNTLSGKFRRNLTRSKNSLKKLGNINFIVIKDNKNSGKNLEIFTELEDSGWKGIEGSSIRAKHWQFFNDLIQNLAKKGWVEWYFLKADERYMAGYLTIPFGRTMYVYKTGFNEDFRSHSPGVVLTEKMLEHIFADGNYETVNFFSDYKWIRRWNIEERPYYIIIIPFKNPVSFLLTQLPYSVYYRFPHIQKIFRLLRKSFR
jgi:hypothetical protein